MKKKELAEFISKKMSMSHIYQPVMLIEILKRKGKASTKQIAESILKRDPTQIEYYSQIVKLMPGKVLTSNRKLTTKEGDNFYLDIDSLTQTDIKELISLCEERIKKFEEKRQGLHWSHRSSKRKPVSGSIRYKVLQRAKFRCELCGASDKYRGLEVDHIVPKSLQGKDDISNYQALCFKCNAEKRNTDDTDFRGQDELYKERKEKCIFCEDDIKQRIVDENTLAYAIRDIYPVSEFHTLFIPKRHTLNYFGLTQAEINAIHQLIHNQKIFIDKKDNLVDGYNIGMNCGEYAGQSVWHCHVHMIPRRKGDVPNPRGGVRHVIPNRGNYKAKSKIPK